MPKAKNVLGEPLETCSTNPMTGFFRSGCCETNDQDVGVHTVCAVMSEEFLAFSRARGNDLTTPAPESGFPGLTEGDRWCLCAARWKQAAEHGIAPRVVLSATHERTLEIVGMEELKAHALDIV